MEMQDIVNNLTDQNVIDQDIVFYLSDVEINSKYIIELLERAYDLEYDEDSDILSYIDENGDRIIAPDLSSGMSLSASWLSDKLPESKIDFEQGGNLRKQQEASSLYKLVCIGVVFESFRTEIKDMLSKYNYTTFAFDGEEAKLYKSAVSFLTKYEKYNSLRINSVISSANIRISRMQEKKDSHWKSKLSQKEITEYGAVSREVKAKIAEYEKERSLNPADIKNLSKPARLSTIDERDREINNIINNSNISKLYKIIKLNSEHLPPVYKDRIEREARKLANAEIVQEEKTGIDAEDYFDRRYAKIIKDLTRFAVATLRSKEIDKYRVSPETYVVKSKS